MFVNTIDVRSFISFENKQQTLHENNVQRIGKEWMVLLVEDAYFLNCFSYLFSRPHSLVKRANVVFFSCKNVNGNLFDVTQRHILSNSIMVATLHIIGSVFLETTLYTVLEHVL